MTNPDENVLRIEQAAGLISQAVEAIQKIYTKQTQTKAAMLKAQIIHIFRHIHDDILKELKEKLI